MKLELGYTKEYYWLSNYSEKAPLPEGTFRFVVQYSPSGEMVSVKGNRRILDEESLFNKIEDRQFKITDKNKLEKILEFILER